MKKFQALLVWLIGLGLVMVSSLSAQYGKQYAGPDDPAGDREAERTGFMNGNNVYLFFRNTTETADCCDLGYWVSRWPADFSGSKMHDGVALLAGARVFIENDSIPVTNLLQIQNRTDLDTLFYCQSSYRVMMDKDPGGNVEWGLYPVFGYFNDAGYNPNPAMSNKGDSWPLDGWPARGDEKKWPGVWNGRFGLGITYADLETYFVVNDAQDLENISTAGNARYFPRPGVKIGDKRPQVTIQRGKPWGGLGIRIEARGFQWKNPEAADCIFWEYTMANISNYDLPEMYFGFFVDNAVGGEEYDADDIACFDAKLDMCFSWDFDGQMIGGGGVPGCMGITYLESPGMATDGIDNDEDGIIDEQRDNVAVNYVDSLAGIASIPAFIDFYGKDKDGDGQKEYHFKRHWDADEDQDWQDGIDANENGVYDAQEFVGDDVGTDGSGPLDLDYPGPDANGTECNHRPDLIEGIGSEPNFGFTDVNESDMLGLTTFRYNLDWGLYALKNDQLQWTFLTQGIFDEAQTVPLNFCEEFATGIFPLFQGRTERISMAELHAMERLHEQTAPPYDAPALFTLKRTVQYIYESDYRFAQPPEVPTLKAIPGDGKVYLYWDNVAEKYTREPLLGNANDFEGYKLYKSTDPYMSDDKIITDGYGTPYLIRPIFECDLVDGKKGFADYGEFNGQEFNLGTDKGITNYYVDNSVMNGRTYYYVLIAYDYGIQDEDIEVAPSFNTYTLNIGRDENVEEISKNVAIVVPHQYAAGYTPSQVADIDYHQCFGKNTMQPEIVIPDSLKINHTYKVQFGSDIINPGAPQYINHGMSYRNSSIIVYDVTAGNSVAYQEDQRYFGVTGNWEKLYDYSQYQIPKEFVRFNTKKELVTLQFDGMRLHFTVPALAPEYDPFNSGWIIGAAAINITPPVREEDRLFPYDYHIIFTDNPSAYVGQTSSATMKDENNQRLDRKDLLLQYPFSFYVETPNYKDSTGANLRAELIGHDVNRNGKFDWFEDRVLVGFLMNQGRRKGLWAGLGFIFDFQRVRSEGDLPKPGHVFQVTFQRGFLPTDSVTFKLQGGTKALDAAALKQSMQKITVIPNPYLVTNVMEPAIGNWQRNQPRRLMFVNLPAQCTIKIFTIAGLLVNEIEVNNATAHRQSAWDTNSEANGTAFWDLRSKEGLEVSAGYYIYHVQARATGDEKVGKLAIIK
ncbi:hypothetical protein L0128_09295 [candidate division KSB1 bacterium]|nr:hypothetical protein [candidate division KSB1 bacterium]